MTADTAALCSVKLQRDGSLNQSMPAGSARSTHSSLASIAAMCCVKRVVIGFRCHAVHALMSLWLLQGMSMLRRVMATTTGMVMTQR